MDNASLKHEASARQSPRLKLDGIVKETLEDGVIDPFYQTTVSVSLIFTASQWCHYGHILNADENIPNKSVVLVTKPLQSPCVGIVMLGIRFSCRLPVIDAVHKLRVSEQQTIR